MAKRCQNCHKELADRAKFCRMCGTPYQLEQPEPLKQPEQPQPVLAETAVPATDILPAREAVVLSGGTSPTEPALLARWQQQSEQRAHVADISEPLIPATNAIVGAFEQAGFALRCGAFMIDSLIFMVLMLVSAIIAGNWPEASSAIQWLGIIVVAIGWVLNFIILAGLTGQTLGKRLVGIRIIAANQHRAEIKQIIVRHLLGYPLSTVVLALGFFWLLWDRQQQGWHDKLAGTIVIRKRLNW